MFYSHQSLEFGRHFAVLILIESGGFPNFGRGWRFLLFLLIEIQLLPDSQFPEFSAH
jgi:hypothetical protein